ncbi:MAG TPA: hypothetical protein VJI73_01940 [Candidatus Paceibacterota bacterium]
MKKTSKNFSSRDFGNVRSRLERFIVNMPNEVEVKEKPYVNEYHMLVDEFERITLENLSGYRISGDSIKPVSSISKPIWSAYNKSSGRETTYSTECSCDSGILRGKAEALFLWSNDYMSPVELYTED